MAHGSVVLIHKIPAIWEIEAKARKSEYIKLSDSFQSISKITKKETNILKNLENDIFYLFSKSVSSYLDVPNLHVVLGYNDKEKRNWDVISKNGKIEYADKFNFWSTNSPDFFPSFDSIEVLILRGNYPTFHNLLIEKYKPLVTIFYPATSLLFPHFEKNIKLLSNRIMRGEIDEKNIEEILENLSKKSIFSKLKTPTLSKKKSSSNMLEFRKSFSKYANSASLIAQKRRNRKSIGNYSIVLYDEEENLNSLRLVYPNSRLLKFNKPATYPFQYDITSIRDIDVIFTGTTLQKTKNFDMFYEIVDNLISLKPDIKICIVGVTGEYGKLNERWGENVVIYSRISRPELAGLYNRSRTHIITSGRDCFPRTIPESVVCGCYVICLDILSDGLSTIRDNPLIGNIIDTQNQLFLLSESFSPTIKILDNSFYKRILDEIKIKRNHFLIAALGSELFSTENMIQLDIIWQEIDLGLSKL